MARPGGNPDLIVHQFKAAEGEESNNARIAFWAPQSTKDRLDKLGRDKSEFLRRAVARALDDLED